MNAEQAKALRDPFPPEAIGKLPKPTKKDNAKGTCRECGGYHGLPAVHLDYVGHAAATDRLLQVDPDWTWKPMAVGPSGEPLIVNGGLWIWLTVCDVTRPGFGDSTGVGGMKETIGDAIRNAAMRFGVALDLWSKEDLHAVKDTREAEERLATVADTLDALREELVSAAATAKRVTEVDGLREKIAAHRERWPAAEHEAWLRKALAAAQKAGGPAATSASTGTPLTDAGDRTTEQPPPADPPGPTLSPPPVEPAVAAGSGQQGGASTFQQPASTTSGPNAPCVAYAVGTTQAKTLKKLDVTVSKGRDAGWWTTEEVFALARDIGGDLIQPDAYWLGEDGKLHYADVRRVVPLWLASQMIEALSAMGEMAKARTAA